MTNEHSIFTHRRVLETPIPYSENPRSDFDIAVFDARNTTIRYEALGTFEEELTKALAENRKPYRNVVIQECLDVIFKDVKQRYLHFTDGMTEEYMAGHYAGAVLCCVKILEHFNLNHDLSDKEQK